MTLALSLGAAGGFGFAAVGLPLPWMLGALSATMVASLADLPLAAPARIRPAVVAVIGVLLGAGFTPELIALAPAWGLSLMLMALYLALSLALVMPWYRRAGGFDRPTAFYSAVPGGLSEMIELGEAAGADVPKIILAQSLRIVCVIAVIAFWFRVVQGYEVGARAPGQSFATLEWHDLGLLALAAVTGAWAGLKLGLPAPTMLGPMIVSAGLHMGGLTQSAPPSELVIAAQIILGTILGCRFRGIRVRALLPAAGLSLGATLIMLALALAFGFLVQALTGQDAEQVLLAFAPGGLTEMSLVAIALHAEVAFVALHHVVRIFLVLAVAPFLARRA